MKEFFGLSRKAIRQTAEVLESIPEGSLLDSMTIEETRFLGVPVSRHIHLEWCAETSGDIQPLVGVE